ncbi:MAG: hypothetical protein Q9195_005929 [Heterodermia aff. obscurata]
MEAYYATVEHISLQLMSVLESGLGLPRDALRSRCIPHAGELRLNHYPAIETQDLKSGQASRIWPHTDFGIITLLFQDDVGGLEIEDRQNIGHFFPVVRKSPGEMTVNVSDTLMRWTNIVLLAGVHQVTTIPVKRKASGNEGVLQKRHSVALLFKTNRDLSAESVSQFVEPKQPILFGGITALEFQQHRPQIPYEK